MLVSPLLQHPLETARRAPAEFGVVAIALGLSALESAAALSAGEGAAAVAPIAVNALCAYVAERRIAQQA